MSTSDGQETQARSGSPASHSEKADAGAHVPTLPADAEASSTTADSPGLAFFLFILCFLMHTILVALHLILVIFRFKLDGNEFRVPLQRLGDITETLFYYVTVYPNILIKVSYLASQSTWYVVIDPETIGLPSPASLYHSEARLEEEHPSQAVFDRYARQGRRVAVSRCNRRNGVEVQKHLASK